VPEYPPAESRTSLLGAVFHPATLRDFARAGLRHSAVAHETTRLLDRHVASGATTPRELSRELPALLADPLTALTADDWLQVARDLIASTEDAFGIRRLMPLIDEADERMASMLFRSIAAGSQTAEQLLGRARELREQADDRSLLLVIRHTSLVIADRYELAAKRKLEQ